MSNAPLVNPVLVDSRNYDQLIAGIVDEMSKSKIIGYDLETHDEDAHEGIKKFRGGDTADAFDWRRIKITGFSLYFDDMPNAYYFNIGHADVENRLTWEQVKSIFEARASNAMFIAHNSVFEHTCTAANFNYVLENVICTLQMAVSCFGPDEYRKEDFIEARFGALNNLFPQIEAAFMDYEAKGGRDGASYKQNKLLGKVLSKSGNARESWNGIIKELAYGYGLKKLVKKLFDFEMDSYDAVLKRHGAAHMGQLTGEQVVAYGADDAYWAVRLYYKLFEIMQTHCPNAINTFFHQENPMTYIFAEIRREGIRIDGPLVQRHIEQERKNFAAAIRELKPAVKLLFVDLPETPCERLFKHEDWYAGRDKEGNLKPGAKDYKFWRQRMLDWTQLPDSPDDLEVAKQVSSSVTEEWMGHKPKVTPLNLTHYYQSRLLMYDLAGADLVFSKGKVQSDAETRGEVLEDLKEKLREFKASVVTATELDQDKVDRFEKSIRMLELLGKLAHIEQRMKLYLAPYSLLMDPETGRIYPEVTCMLATRRMACSNPNGMQLPKRGESTYIRGFILPDNDDHVLVAPDWSQIELVEIGDFSGDPEFAKAFSTIPYQDLHMGTAADLLSVLIPVMTEEMLRTLDKMPLDQIPEQALVNIKGEKMTPKEAKKYWRTELGKGGNFSYWYSGALATIAEKMGWSSDVMWKAVDKFRSRFAVAEAWRVNLYQQAEWVGYVELPDGHRRYRWEVTHEFKNIVQNMFDQYGQPGISKFGARVIKDLATRARNQIVNAYIQGTCATLAKRSIIRIREEIKKRGFRASFKMPIHDELVYSVHKDDAVEFIKMIKFIMADHPDIIKNLKINCSVGMGRTFEPFHMKKAPMGLIELDEIPAFDFVPEQYHDKALPIELVPQVIDYLFKQERKMAA